MGYEISEALAARVAAVFPQLLEALAAGKSINAKCAELGITPDALYAYRRRNPEVMADWSMAHEQSADAIFDRFLTVLDERPQNQVEATDKRTRLDMLRWAAAKRNPRAYSDKAQIDVNVRTIDLTATIERAHARLMAARPLPVATIHSAALPDARARAQDAQDAEIVRSVDDLL